jgi:hypothetical protein
MLLDKLIEIKNLRKHKLSEPYDFYIDRRSVLGNPYTLYCEEERNKCCDLYDQYFQGMVERNNKQFIEYLEEIKKALDIYGQVRLFCWCHPKRCHGETIKKYLENRYG